MSEYFIDVSLRFRKQRMTSIQITKTTGFLPCEKKTLKEMCADRVSTGNNRL